jgi:hypothetical protein
MLQDAFRIPAGGIVFDEVVIVRSFRRADHSEASPEGSSVVVSVAPMLARLAAVWHFRHVLQTPLDTHPNQALQQTADKVVRCGSSFGSPLLKAAVRR